MFEIQELEQVEATGSLVGNLLQCAGTWGAAAVLYMAVVAC